VSHPWTLASMAADGALGVTGRRANEDVYRTHILWMHLRWLVPIFLTPLRSAAGPKGSSVSDAEVASIAYSPMRLSQ
jgi:hypothetical protein